MESSQELEIIQHNRMRTLKVLLVDMTARQLHAHTDLEIDLLLSGRLFVRVEDEHFHLQPGEICIINGYHAHSFLTQSPGAPARLLSLQIDRGLYHRLDPTLRYLQFDNTLLHSGPLHDQVQSLSLDTARCYFSEDPHSELRCAGLLLTMLHLLIEQTHCHLQSERDYIASRNASNRLNRITEYVMQNHASRLTLEDLAEREHISRYHLSHDLKKMLGISFQEYLNNVRFEHAFRLVNTTDFNILDICLETGFSSSRYLNEMFEKRLGMDVRSYRKAKEKPPLLPYELPAENIQRQLSEKEAAAFLSMYA